MTRGWLSPILRLAAAAALLIALAPAPARPSDKSAGPASAPDEVLFGEIPAVQGASRFDQPVSEAPSAITVVTAEQIRRFGYRTLADLLRGVRSFYGTYDRMYDYVGVRGYSPPADLNNRFLLLIDGHRTNDGIYEQAALGTDAILDIDLVDRVEIVRGAGSALYGANAFFGVINVVTRSPRSVANAELSAAVHRYDGYKGRVTLGHGFGDGSRILLSGSGWRSGGRDLYFPTLDAPETNNGIAEGKDGDRSRSLFGTVVSGNFTLRAAWSSREKEVPTGVYDTVFNAGGTRVRDERYFADLLFEKRGAADSAVSARLYFDGYGYDGDYVYADAAINPDPPNRYLNRDVARSRAYGAELAGMRRFGGRHKLTGGLEFRNDYRQDQKNFDAEPFYTAWLDDRSDSFSWGAFLQDEIALADTVLLSAAARYDRHPDFAGRTSPRLALILNPAQGTTVKLLYGRAYRAPSAFERLYATSAGGLMVPNPDLKPESITSYEAVLEQAIGPNVRLTLDGFHNRLSRLIGQVVLPDGSAQMQNGGGVRTLGAEAEIDARWESGVQALASATFQRTVDARTRETLTNSPQRLLKGNLYVPLAGDRLGAGLEILHTGNRKTLEGHRTDGKTLVNLTLSSRQLIDGLDLSASVYDLFGARHDETASGIEPMDSIPQDRRTFRLKASYAF
jgi:iron complex outermembrane receptor protein